MSTGIPTTGKREFMTQKERFLLTSLMVSQYEKSGMTKAEFAEYATLELKPSKSFKDHNIRDIAHAMGLKDPVKIAPTLESLERRIKQLEDRIEVYCQGSRK